MAGLEGGATAAIGRLLSLVSVPSPGRDLWISLLSVFLGLAGAGLLVWIGWMLNRRRLRRAVARVLFFQVKLVRQDWVFALKNSTPPPPYALFPRWAELQTSAIDLFPEDLLSSLLDLSFQLDRTNPANKMWNPTHAGIKEIWVFAAKSERALAKYAGRVFDPSAQRLLEEYEKAVAKPNSPHLEKAVTDLSEI